MKNSKTFTTISLIFGLIGIGTFFLFPYLKLGTSNIIFFGAMALSVFAIIFAVRGRKTGKGAFIGSLIFSIIALIITSLMLLTSIVVGGLENCTEKNDKYYTCDFGGQKMDYPKKLKDLLEEKQFKK